MISFELFTPFDTFLRCKELKCYHEKSLKGQTNLTKFD